jgi:hypothetical protein
MQVILVETIPRIRGWEDKEQRWRGEFKYDIYDTL